VQLGSEEPAKLLLFRQPHATPFELAGTLVLGIMDGIIGYLFQEGISR